MSQHRKRKVPKESVVYSVKKPRYRKTPSAHLTQISSKEVKTSENTKKRDTVLRYLTRLIRDRKFQDIIPQGDASEEDKPADVPCSESQFEPLSEEKLKILDKQIQRKHHRFFESDDDDEENLVERPQSPGREYDLQKEQKKKAKEFDASVHASIFRMFDLKDDDYRRLVSAARNTQKELKRQIDEPKEKTVSKVDLV